MEVRHTNHRPASVAPLNTFGASTGNFHIVLCILSDGASYLWLSPLCP